MKFLLKLLRRMYEGALEAFIPVHTKRIIFLITLYQMARKGTELSEEELEELNAALQLAKTTTASLHVPCIIAESLGLKYETPITSCGPKDMEMIIANTPKWLRYGRADDLLRDMGQLRQFARTHPA